MAHFERRAVPPIVAGGYRSYKPFVREDFSRQCGYCLLPEILAGGERNFELDHFRPKSQFPDLLRDFFNLYYACHPCNFTKLDNWPLPELEAKGITFVDLCQDEFEAHFRVKPDGEWAAITESGSYTIEMLRLNRGHLVTLRELLSKIGFVVHEGHPSDDDLRRQLQIT